MLRQSYSLENMNIGVTLGLLSMHVLAIAAIFFHSWNAVLLCFGLSISICWVGIGLCYHRLETHKSFKTPRWFRYVLLIIGALNFQGGIRFWKGKHLVHHKFSDEEGDPHSPVIDGFSWAHVIWIVFRKEGGHEWSMYSRDVAKDRGAMLIDRFSGVPQVVLGLLLFYLGGFTWVVWGIGVRTVITYHMTWFVNSAAHTWGYRTFQTDDNSRNLPWVAMISGGEGWHNNHHSDQRSASHGMLPGELDITYELILFLSRFGLTYDIVKPKMWSR